MIKKTKAQKQAEYRLKKRNELGDDEYKRLEAERQRNKYNANKPLIIIEKLDENIELPKLQPLKKRINPISKTLLVENSIKTYISTIKIIYNFYTKKTLSDDNEIIKTINSQPYKYKIIKNDFIFLFDNEILNNIIKKYKSRLDILYGIVSRIYGFSSIVKKLAPYINKINDINKINRANRIIPDNVINTVSFDKIQIIKKVEEANLTNYEKIIAYITLLIPTRRLHDYRFTKNINNIPKNINNKLFNYYYNKKIYIYNTKNKKFDIINIPDEITNLININDEFIFGKYYNQSALSKLFSSIMFKIYNIKINATLIRILYSSYLRSLNLNSKEWEDNALKMGHSLSESIKYSYVPIKDN